MSAGSAIDSFNFQATNSVGDVGMMDIDDITYGTMEPVPEPATWITGALVTGLMLYARSPVELRTEREKNPVVIALGLAR